MGLLRLFLALSVAFQHAGKPWGIGGGRAVEIFFIISGFYMGLVLCSGKYSSYKGFLVNRFLRIFPLYWIVALLSIVLALLIFLFNFQTPSFLYSYIHYGNNLKIGAWLFFMFNNFFIFTQEWTHLLELHEDQFYFSLDFTPTTPLVSSFLFVPQAWSLGLELLFYLIAPIILWRNKKNALKISLVFLCLSLFCKIALLLSGFPYDPWAYRFFPSVFYLFVLGILSYQFYAKNHLKLFSKKTIMAGVIGTSFLMLVYYTWLAPHKTEFIQRFLTQFTPSQAHLFKIAEVILHSTVPYLICAILICLVFHLTAKNGWDRWLGELSYPLYICHILVINLLAIFLPGNASLPYIALTISLIFSIILAEFIQKPIDQYRSSFFKQPAKRQEIAGASWHP